jgi:hypothetical protein
VVFHLKRLNPFAFLFSLIKIINTVFAYKKERVKISHFHSEQFSPIFILDGTILGKVIDKDDYSVKISTFCTCLVKVRKQNKKDSEND